MPTTVEKKEPVHVSVSPFGIEADNPRNSDLNVQSVPDGKLRTAVKSVVEVFTRPDGKQGDQETTTTGADVVKGLPSRIPGMRLFVNPGELTYKIVDPLYDDEAFCERIQKALKAGSDFNVADKIKGVKPREGYLHKDDMKNLVREMLWLIDSGDAKVVKGVKPDMGDIDELPGDYLTDVRNRSHFNQPRYEKDMDAWKEGLNRM
jgi:hypothetical protein